MKKALVSTIETVTDLNGTVKGNRIVGVKDAQFEAHESLFWVDCEDETNEDFYYYDGKVCKPKDWIVKPSEEEIATANVRFIRDGLLKESDLIVTRHYEKGTGVPAEWVEYRQKLRDIPQQLGFPMDVVYPEKPTS